ncbi:enoyl-CoA hydratase/isomerase family protein [Labedaea rhizosphaerae]|uniref:enoyl-CoA hydratase n=1 Tax=Labedaea rhizosphaerae TaxID=598644 RepID=A0A4V3CZD3_LABRH|nr:enoyl-CoA hydratase/isomerase family protein [Labedaea rhizosphaerae]TDP97568.1 enoyl-CoA hydratase [Labedaea rhizosphaerae]
MAEFVKLEVEDGIGTIRLQRPPMNAINRQLQAELRAAAYEARDRDDVKAVIVYGGEKVFAAGADVKEFAPMDYNAIADYGPELSGAITAIAELPMPTVAAITGYALGGGYELALACDRRICGDNSKVGQPEILLGIIPGAGGTQRLARLVGPAKAKDIVYTGRFVGAEEALAIGMVDQVVAPDDVYKAARDWAGQFTGAASRALAAAKAAIDGGLDGDLANGLKLETALFAALFNTEDRTTGMASFIENGPGKAQFNGR